MKPKYGEIMKIAIYQMNSCANVSQNMENIRKAVIEASVNKASLICLPENCHFFTTNKELSKGMRELLTGNVVDFYKNLAKEYSISISLGGFPEIISEDEEKRYNSHILINEAGEIDSVYRKIHLFDVNIDEKNTIRESEKIKAGSEVVVSKDEIGLSVCYDLRFPELYRRMSTQGAKIFLIPAAFLQKTGEAHWEILLRARAIENQCFVIAAAQTGILEDTRKSYGHSMVIDAWGKVLLDMKDEVGVGYAELDFRELEETRKKLPCLTHIRKDLFSLYPSL